MKTNPKRAFKTTLVVAATLAAPSIALLALNVYTGLDVSAYGDNSVPVGSRSAAIGIDNSIGETNAAAYDSLAVGAVNEIHETGGTAYYNLVVGLSNTIDGDKSVAFGQYNQVLDDYSMAQGEGIIINHRHAAVVGQYNDEFEYPGQEAFAVGVGDDNYTRKNAFLVLQNGDVIIPKPQGDIPMYSGSQ